MSNSTGGSTYPVNPTGPEPTTGRPDYSGSRWRVFFSRIWSRWFSLRSSPQKLKKPELTELYSIFRRDFLNPARFQLDSWNLHQIWRDLVVYAQIQLQFNGFCSNKAQICWKYNAFCSNLAKLRWYLLKSGDDLVYFCSNLVIFAKIMWRFDFFCLNLVIFVQIQWRSSEKYRSPSKCNLRQHHRWLRPIRPLIKQLRSDMTRWFLRLVAGLLTGNSMWSGRFRVGHKPNPDRSVDTPNNSND